jgi:nickel transport protein
MMMARTGFAHLSVLVALLIAGPLAVPAPAHAHGAGWQIEDSANTKTYGFRYTDGSPMAFAEVVVTTKDGKVWQKARTDRIGQFSLGLGGTAAQDAPRELHIKVADGMGHVVQLTYQPSDTTATTVTAPSAGGQTAAASSATAIQGTPALFDLPLWASILFGCSILANLFGGLLLWQRRQMARKRSN